MSALKVKDPLEAYISWLLKRAQLKVPSFLILEQLCPVTTPKEASSVGSFTGSGSGFSCWPLMVLGEG